MQRYIAGFVRDADAERELRGGNLEIRYEDTVADLESEARRLLEFLELPWNEDVLSFQERSKRKHIRTPSYEAVIKPIHNKSIGRWTNYAKYLEPYLEKLEPFIKEFKYS